MERVKNIFTIVLRIGISIAILVFLFRQVDEKSLAAIIKNADKALLLVAFIVFFLCYALAVLRWQMLLKALKIHISLKRVMISFAGGAFFSLFLPSTIGGDLMRSVDLATHTHRPREVIATVLLDRLSGYVGLVLLAVLALCFGGDLVRDPVIFIGISVIVGVLLVILLVIFNRSVYLKINWLLHSPNAGKFREMIKELHHELHIFRRHKDVIIKNIILSMFIQAVPPLTFYVIAIALGLKIGFGYFFIFLPIIGAITLLPISIGGLGLRDASTILFFAKVGVAKDMAFAMSLLNFSFILIYGAIGGLIYVSTFRHRRIQHHQPPGIHPHHQSR